MIPSCDLRKNPVRDEFTVEIWVINHSKSRRDGYNYL